MFLCDRSGSARGLAMVLGAAVVIGAAGAAAQELRTVLATGDDVPRFGRIGAWGLHLAGIDDRGRALVSRVDVEGEESFWADGERFTPLIAPDSAGDVELMGYTLAVDGAGHAAGHGRRRGTGDWWGQTLYSVVGGQLAQVARVGDRDADGNTICELHSHAINGSGSVAFAATVSPDGYACPDFDADEITTPYYDALYLADGGLRRVAGTGPLSPAGWDVQSLGLLTLTDAGDALATVLAARSAYVLALAADGVRVLYRLGEADGPGEISRGAPYGFDLLGVNDAGDLAFRRLEGELAGIHRTAAGSVHRVPPGSC